MEALKEKEQEIRQLKPPEPETQVHAVNLEETEEDISQNSSLEVLKGKVVAIIGGQRQRQATSKMYPCDIIVHPGEPLDPEFYQALKQADIIVVLTQFVSHACMWEAKAYALQEDKGIYFAKGLNLGKILYELSTRFDENRLFT